MVDSEKIKDLIQAHELIISLSNDVKDLRKAKRSLEIDVTELKIEVVDTPQYRLYRQDDKLIPYKKELKDMLK